MAIASTSRKIGETVITVATPTVLASAPIRSSGGIAKPSLSRPSSANARPWMRSGTARLM